MTGTMTVHDLKDHADRLSGLLDQKQRNVRLVVDPDDRRELLSLISALRSRVAEISTECDRILAQTATAAV